MNLLPIIILAVVPMLAFAQDKAKEDEDKKVFITRWVSGDWLRLYKEPCSVVSGWLKFYRAEYFYRQKNYHACWKLVRHAQGASILVVDDNDEISTHEPRIFTVDEGV